MKEFTPQAKAVNDAANILGKALLDFKKVCDKQGHPIRGVSFRVEGGNRRLRIIYKTKCQKTKT